jgi:hypothetical protein
MHRHHVVVVVVVVVADLLPTKMKYVKAAQFL